jgi:uncharacterized protein with FMN-binding domain
MGIIIVVIFAVLGIVALIGVLADAPGRREIEELTFSDVKFTNLHDGTYVGDFNGTKAHTRDTKVEMTVKDGEIKDIKILKGALGKDGKPVELKGGLSIDNLFNSVVQSQNLQVDVISGATITSKSHLKALENALVLAQPKDENR